MMVPDRSVTPLAINPATVAPSLRLRVLPAAYAVGQKVGPRLRPLLRAFRVGGIATRESFVSTQCRPFFRACQLD